MTNRRNKNRIGFVQKLELAIVLTALGVKHPEIPLNGAFSRGCSAWFYISTLFRHVDGHDYMWALSEMLESAREVVFIMVECSSCILICAGSPTIFW